MSQSSPPDTVPQAHDAFVGRQPIFNQQLQVIAYELLFRDSWENRGRFVDGDQATSQVIINAFLNIGLEALVGNKRAFINLSRDFLLEDYSLVFPPDRVGIEFVDDLADMDAALLKKVRDLSAQGYTIALDILTYHETLQPLLELVDLVKLDVSAVSRTELQEHVALLREYDVKLLAERVETQDDLTYCIDLGFDYFQGFFLHQPDVIQGQRSPSNRLTILPLLAKLMEPDLEFQDLENLISRDVSLSYKLLRLINSAFYARSSKVDSLRQALLLLGTKFISNWVSLFLMAGFDDKPNELLVSGMVRAKMCELLAQDENRTRQAVFFTAGLFSILDALMNCPMQEALDSLPLSDALIQALLHHEGKLGAALQCTLAYERGDWDAVIYPGLEGEAIRDAYLGALAWAAEMGNIMGE